MRTFTRISLIVVLLLCLYSNFPLNVSAGVTIDVEVTENIPWLWCSEADWIITCPVEPWLSSFTIILQTLVRWFSYMAMIWAVLFIIINGILYSMWWNKEEIKKRIVTTLMWTIVLLMSWVILYLVAPWVYYA